MSADPPLITDAAPSFADEQDRRRRVYVWIMVVHLAGFAGSYPLFLWRPWAGAALVIATGLLPWVAVIVANGSPRRSRGRVPAAGLPGARRASAATLGGGRADPATLSAGRADPATSTRRE